MSALAESTMLTRSGITRLIDGLVAGGLIERVSCPNDARVSYAQLTDAGYEKLRSAGCTHVASIRRLFLEHFTPDEIEQLAALLSRLPGAQPRRRLHGRVAPARSRQLQRYRPGTLPARVQTAVRPRAASSRAGFASARAYA